MLKQLIPLITAGCVQRDPFLFRVFVYGTLQAAAHLNYIMRSKHAMIVAHGHTVSTFGMTDVGYPCVHPPITAPESFRGHVAGEVWDISFNSLVQIIHIEYNAGYVLEHRKIRPNSSTDPIPALIFIMPEPYHKADWVRPDAENKLTWHPTPPKTRTTHA